MSTYLDYDGRVYDVLAFRGATEGGVARLDQSLVDDESGGEVCTGAQMVAQAWLTEFMTEQGSVGYAPEAGCPFMTALKQGRMRAETDVFQYFNLSSAGVRRNLLSAEDGTEPAEDRFSKAVLNAVTVSPGYVTLNVSVSTLAGTSRKVILPIEIVP